MSQNGGQDLQTVVGEFDQNCDGDEIAALLQQLKKKQNEVAERRRAIHATLQGLSCFTARPVEACLF